MSLLKDARLFVLIDRTRGASLVVLACAQMIELLSWNQLSFSLGVVLALRGHFSRERLVRSARLHSVTLLIQ